MEIKSTITDKSGQTIDFIYYEGMDPTQSLEGKVLDCVHAYCFYKNKFVIVYTGKKDIWTPPGGHIEEGESIEQAVIREVEEESNMKVLHQELIGFQDIYEPNQTIRQTRSFCIVEPYGEFVADKDIEGDITAIKLIDPKDFKQYFDWLKIGDRVMERALEMLKEYK